MIRQKRGKVALYMDGELTRVVSYNSVPHRQRIIDLWMKETRNLKASFSYVVNPDLKAA